MAQRACVCGIISYLTSTPTKIGQGYYTYIQIYRERERATPTKKGLDIYIYTSG